MDAICHRQVLERTLGGRVSSHALEAIYQANVGQDRLSGLIGHPEYHFDDNAIPQGLAYIEECRALAARAESPAEAWIAFGRLTHAAQDFYSHSNYVSLWMEQITPLPASAPRPIGKNCDGGRESWPPIESIDGLDPTLLKHPRLMTCHVYMPLDALYFFPGLGLLVKRLLPKDSHAWMNLDNPETGPLFPYSIEAAVQRTIAEYERTLAAMGEEAVRAFRDQ